MSVTMRLSPSIVDKIAAELSPSSGAEILSHPEGVVSSPRAVVPQIRRPKIAISRAQPVKQEVLGHAKFESLAQINSQSPRMLDPDCVKRPSVERLRNIPAKQKCGLPKQHESA